LQSPAPLRRATALRYTPVFAERWFGLSRDKFVTSSSVA